MLRLLYFASAGPRVRAVFHPLSRAMASYSHLVKDKAFVNGTWVAADDGRTFEVLNPSNGETLAAVPDMGAKETLTAIAAARASFDSWRRMTAKQRGDILLRWHRVLADDTEALASLMTAENGKPLSDSTGEVAYGNGFLEWFAAEGRRAGGEVISTPVPSRRLFAIRQPIGVVAVITPWNFPLAMITRKVGAALAAGCPVVVKPAEDTPLTALALAHMAQEAGLPAGVFNVVTCSRRNTASVGQVLCESRDVQCVSFTGSTAVGRELLRLSAPTVKRVNLELGGNAPFIVFETGNVEKAVQGAMASKFRCSGQTCVSPNRFFVHAKKYDAFIETFAREVAKLKVGDGLAAGTNQGPLINAAGVDKVERHVRNAVELGAKPVVGGKRLSGNFFEPTVLADCTPDMMCLAEETFGPLAPVMKFTDEAEVLKLANSLSLGLAGYFYSEDLAQVWRVAEALEVGMVGVNEGLISGVETPFGGVKESGLGREGGTHGIEEFLEVKFVCMGNVV